MGFTNYLRVRWGFIVKIALAVYGGGIRPLREDALVLRLDYFGIVGVLPEAVEKLASPKHKT